LGIYAPCDDLHSGFETRINYMFDSLISACNYGLDLCFLLLNDAHDI
jgi:hypothetical protein